ncbi:L30e-like protein [Echria macrotheca]|uniref:L30e-like protein n=1 Tax=Echria macrotheca TaxID=438768 RepID=A0AAJ0BEK0_9PEZI|nr:L30e-like protein [Echria macrotheca]
MGSGDKVDAKVKDKKEKKEKKEKADKADKADKKRSETGGIQKETKDKKKEKKKLDKLTRALDAHLQKDAAATSDLNEDAGDVARDVDLADVDPEDIVETAKELVPYALPLANPKTHKKIYKTIKKGAKNKALNRGVKEVEKAIKKCPLKTNTSSTQEPAGLVIIAADISPMDVIMHFPLLCEEHGVPYLFVDSRAELGTAACTKRATSIVMLKPEGKSDATKDKKSGDEEGGKKSSVDEYRAAWLELVKTAQKEWTAQVEPWVKGIHPLQLTGN